VENAAVTAGALDDAGRFLEEVERWQDRLAELPRLVHAVVFQRLCEDRRVVARGEGHLGGALRALDARFHGWLLGAADSAPSPALDDAVRHFSGVDTRALGADILGRSYERSLERRQRHARKSSGVYYTPDHVVRYMVEGTLGTMLEGQTPDDVAALHVLDPACGSGSFLLGAFDRLVEWHRAWYLARSPADGALYRDRHGEWQLTSAKRVEILVNNIYGVDLDEHAVDVTRLSLSLRALEGELDEPRGSAPSASESLAPLAAHVRSGNSLVSSEFDYQTSFPEVFARGGFEVVLGNPPYVSYGGRQAVPISDSLRRYFARAYESGGWATAHSLFMERSAKELSRRLVSFIVPDQVGHLAGYRSLRELLARQGSVVEVRYWGENVFKGVVTPSLTFVLDRASPGGETRILNADGTEQRARIEEGHAWTASGAEALLDKLRKGSTSIRRYLADCGVRTTDAKKQVVELAGARGEFMAVLEGRQIGRYSCAPPEVAVLLDAGAKVYVSREEKYLKAEFLIRQTAAYPVVGPREHATHFRNSLHALYPPDNGWDVRYVVGLLNSKLLRFAYVARVREAHQRAFPQVKLGPLGDLPIRDLRLDVPEDRARHDRVVGLVADMLAAKRELGAAKAPLRAALEARVGELDRSIDREVFRLYDLTEAEIETVEEAVGALALPP
jgi:Eco57I restriction-modification methylase/TaqI-like C-terminal specificity domain